MVTLRSDNGRMAADAGVAIGPILFIVAILAILAAAIAAGSGSFTGGTGAENNKTKSTALVQIGENLRMGMDRITLSGQVLVDDVNIDIADMSATGDLFSPLGGGIAPPSPGMAANPAYDKWYFPRGTPSGFGTGVSDTVMAVLPVTRGVCAEVNNRSMGAALVPPTTALGNFVAATPVVEGTWPNATGTWTVGATTTAATVTPPTLVSVGVGCVWNSDITDVVTANCSVVGSDGVGTTCTAGPTSPFFFYQVLAIQ